eukprot:5575228-Prymnesium_polylepis.1
MSGSASLFGAPCPTWPLHHVALHHALHHVPSPHCCPCPPRALASAPCSPRALASAPCPPRGLQAEALDHDSLVANKMLRAYEVFDLKGIRFAQARGSSSSSSVIVVVA